MKVNNQAKTSAANSTVLNRRFVDQTSDFKAGTIGNQKVVSYTAGMAVDTDGAGASHGDKTHQSKTSLSSGGKYVNGDVTPYVALPPAVAKAAGMKLGDLVRVTAPNGKQSFAIYGDNSDNASSRKVGEGSRALLQSLGYSGKSLDPNSGGVGSGMKYELLPGTKDSAGTLKNGFPDAATLNSIGTKAVGGTAATSSTSSTGSAGTTGNASSTGDGFVASAALETRLKSFNGNYTREVSRADIEAGKVQLQPGDKGEAVKDIQKKLGIKADGLYGPVTAKAVAAYQKANGLTTASQDDGCCGKTTLANIDKKSASSSASGTSSTDAASTTGTSGTGSVAATSTMQRFANIAKQTALNMNGYTSRGQCAKGVSQAISNAFGVKVYGNGNQIDNNLPKNKFKQLNISLEEALKTPGLVLTWEKTSTAGGQKYGHTAVTVGDGKGSVSDFVENNTLGAKGRTGFKVFQPIG
jgi:peptidoglycan hydrolase-like protein with peptidoglycan-binding domain